MPLKSAFSIGIASSSFMEKSLPVIMRVALSSTLALKLAPFDITLCVRWALLRIARMPFFFTSAINSSPLLFLAEKDRRRQSHTLLYKKDRNDKNHCKSEVYGCETGFLYG